MLKVKPRKREWERGLINFNKVFTEENFNYFKDHKEEILTMFRLINAKYSIDEWNKRVTAYYDYLNEIMPGFFDALYGIIANEK